jgi:hypothetical protein
VARLLPLSLPAWLLAIALWFLQPAEAHACSILAEQDAARRLQTAIDNWSELVLVGVVTRETRVYPSYDATGRYTGLVPVGANPSREVRESDPIYTSRVRLEAVLKGEAPAGDIELPWLNQLSPGCQGGPRLPAGQRVLLFLKSVAGDSDAGGRPVEMWQMSLHGGAVTLTPGDAAVVDLLSADTPQSLGPSEAVLRSVGEQLGSRAGATEDAVAALGASIQVEGDGGSDLVIPVLILIGVVAVVLLAAVRYLLHLERPPEDPPRR